MESLFDRILSGFPTGGGIHYKSILDINNDEFGRFGHDQASLSLIFAQAKKRLLHRKKLIFWTGHNVRALSFVAP